MAHLPAWLELLKPSAFLLGLAAALALERLRPHAGAGPDLRVNGALWLLDAAILALVCGACTAAAGAWAEARGIGLLHVAPLPAAPALVATLAGLDLVSYAWHRANHRIAFLWRFHRVHHSDASFTVTTALRFHPGELLLSLPVRMTAVVLLGAPVAAVIVFEAVFAIANLVEHGDIDLPASLEARLARVLIVPALHRRHHSIVTRELNSNFGTIFSVWDRLFGTFGPSSSSERYTIGLCTLRGRSPALGEVLRMPLQSPARDERG